MILKRSKEYKFPFIGTFSPVKGEFILYPIVSELIIPKPLTCLIVVTTSNFSGIRIVNAIGQTVIQRTLLKEDPKQEFSFSEEEIPPGIYQLQLLGNRGEKVNVKFVVLSK